MEVLATEAGVHPDAHKVHPLDYVCKAQVECDTVSTAMEGNSKTVLYDRSFQYTSVVLTHD